MKVLLIGSPVYLLAQYQTLLKAHGIEADIANEHSNFAAYGLVAHLPPESPLAFKQALELLSYEQQDRMEQKNRVLIFPRKRACKH